MLEWRPGLHSVQLWFISKPVADEYVPGEQFTQVDSSTLPTVLLHFPLPHRLHIVLSELAYLPTEQLLQLAPAVLT